jgi:carbon storage regulator
MDKEYRRTPGKGMGKTISPENGGSTMLVLSRKSQESVVVGGSDGVDPVLTVTVLEISGGKVRLGFEAEAGVAVHRWEVWERIRAGGRPDGPAGEPAALVP